MRRAQLAHVKLNFIFRFSPGSNGYGKLRTKGRIRSFDFSSEQSLSFEETLHKKGRVSLKVSAPHRTKAGEP